MLKDKLLRDGLITQAEYDKWEAVKVNKEAIKEIEKLIEDLFV